MILLLVRGAMLPVQLVTSMPLHAPVIQDTLSSRYLCITSRSLLRPTGCLGQNAATVTALG